MAEKEPPFEFQKRHAQRLSDENGNFISQYPGKVGKGYSIGYLEELCEWTFFNDNFDLKEKEKRILDIEEVIKRMLASPKYRKGGIKYIPTWSKKLKK